MSGKVVMIAGEGESTCIVFHALRASVGVEKVLLEDPVPTKQFLKRRVEKLGLRTVAGQLLFMAAVDRPLRARSAERRREIKRELGLDDSPLPEADCVRVGSINSPVAQATLQALAPKVVVVNGTRIVAKRILESVDAPFLNMHAGITPLYRGVHGGYWALAENDPAHCGVTVHLVDPGIDTGGIIGQALITPTSRDNFSTYPLLQVAAGIPLMIEAVKSALAGTLRPKPAPEGTSRLWSHPTLGQYVKARLQNGTR